MGTEKFELYKQDNERIDDLQIGGLHILQNPDRFCFGMDAVLLSGFTSDHEKNLKADSSVLDLGSGTGILPILLSAKTHAGKLEGIEIMPGAADMANRSIKMNGIDSRVNIKCGDLKNISDYYKAGEFDVACSNPPYTKMGDGLLNEADDMVCARHEIHCDFNDVCRAAAYALKNKGRFYLVHRPYRLPELFETLRQNNLEPKVIRFVHSFIDKECTMVLIRSVKGGAAELRIESPLVIYERPGVYSPEVRGIYERIEDELDIADACG